MAYHLNATHFRVDSNFFEVQRQQQRHQEKIIVVAAFLAVIAVPSHGGLAFRPAETLTDLFSE